MVSHADKNSTPHDFLKMKNTRIFVVGDLILDSYIEGSVSRISPEAPVPVVLEKNRRHVPGGAGNVAANISSVGAAVSLCGRIGADTEGSILRNLLDDDFSIDTESLVVSHTTPTISKIRVMSGIGVGSGAQQIVRIDKENNTPLSAHEENRVIELYERFLFAGGHCALVLSDYGKGCLTKPLIQRLILLSQRNNVPIVVDPKSIDVERYKGATVIKPNLSEGRSVFKAIKPGLNISTFQNEIEEIANTYLEASGCENLVMSLSEHGIMVKEKGEIGTFRFESKALQVFDVSGAGDTLVAFLAMGLAAGITLSRTTELANIAAGIVCGKLGTATVSPSEFLDAFKEHSEAIHPEKLMKLDDLLVVMQDLKKNQDKSVVFTNGCFDILHAGHVQYLQKARALGDYLVIGLNSDSSVSRLKGPKRPVQSSCDRAAVLGALACVDYIVLFEEDTPLQTILTLKPNILVKGADYNLENTIGAKEVLSWGGSVEHVSLLEGRSTTSILQRVTANSHME